MIDLIAGVGDVFRFFGQLINSLPAVFLLLGSFCFGLVLLIGMMHLLRR